MIPYFCRLGKNEPNFQAVKKTFKTPAKPLFVFFPITTEISNRVFIPKMVEKTLHETSIVDHFYRFSNLVARRPYLLVLPAKGKGYDSEDCEWGLWIRLKSSFFAFGLGYLIGMKCSRFRLYTPVSTLHHKIYRYERGAWALYRTVHRDHGKRGSFCWIKQTEPLAGHSDFVPFHNILSPFAGLPRLQHSFLNTFVNMEGSNFDLRRRDISNWDGGGKSPSSAFLNWNYWTVYPFVNFFLALCKLRYTSSLDRGNCGLDVKWLKPQSREKRLNSSEEKGGPFIRKNSKMNSIPGKYRILTLQVVNYNCGRNSHR